MAEILKKLSKGYRAFREKYYQHDHSVMEMLSSHGQKPEIMVVACCDSRVDPAILLQCGPGELFVVRNVANIIPPYENDEYHHGTSAALEFAVCYLKVKHLIILGHSQCGGLDAYLNQDQMQQNDFITDWVEVTNLNTKKNENVDECAKLSINSSYHNCLTFPWLKERTLKGELSIHRWFFNIKTAELQAYSNEDREYKKLEEIHP